jgi:hypothetical protein
MKMRFFFYFFIFLLSLNFVGCASKKRFVRDDYTPQLWGRDYGSCSAQGTQAAGPPPVNQGALASIIWRSNKDRMDYYCLIGKGWRYVDEQGNDAPPP